MEKMKFTAYYKDTFNEGDKVSGSDFEVLVNPESYKRDYKPMTLKEDAKLEAAGEIIDSVDYLDLEKESFSIDILFDSTGAIPGTGDKTVKDELEKFKKLVLYYDGTIHSNYFVKISWGSLIFKGRLKNMSINYELFKPSGEALRAKVNASFEQVIDAETKNSMRNRSSPDLSHVRTVKAGDTLPLLCYKIYRDSSLYTQVAKANELSNFMSIFPGQQLLFPPIEK